MTPDRSQRRNTVYTGKLQEQGLRQVVVWVPEEARNSVQEAARTLRLAAGKLLMKEQRTAHTSPE